MKLKGFKIGNATYFVNEKQIAAAGNIKKAAQKEHDKANPIPKLEPKEVKVKKAEKVETK